jgi:predicted secreted protein
MAISTAKGTIIKLSNQASPVSYASISQVRSITGPTTKPTIVDITTHDTPGFWRRKLSVLVDPGQLSFKINFDRSDATHYTTGLWSQLTNLYKSGFQMIFPNGAGTLSWAGYVSSFQWDAPVDNVLGAAVSIDITDAIAAS